MAQTFRQRIAQAEAMARADMLRFQPEVFICSCILVHSYFKRCYFVHLMKLIEPLWFLLQSGLTLSSDGILGPLAPDLPAEGLDLSEVPPADEDA